MNRVVITGANEGIGYYMLEELLKQGKKVAVLDINLNNLQNLTDMYNNNILLFKCDVSNYDCVIESVNKAVIEFGGIDCAIHNACKCLFTSLEETSIDDYKRVYDVNFYGAINLTKAVLPIMKQQKKGKVFFTSSGVGIMGFINISAYASSKGALESLAKCLNIENHKFGISFHIFHPPLTKTTSAEPLPVPNEFKADPKKVGKGLAKRIKKNKFIICHSNIQTIQTKMAYLFPITLGKLMSKMTANYKKSIK